VEASPCLEEVLGDGESSRVGSRRGCRFELAAEKRVEQG
jgi:hypothetical protein